MRELIEFIARAIVEYPDDVQVVEEDDGDQTVLRLTVADSDMGKVIGKQGRIANAMRTLLKVAAIRRGARAILEIGDGRPPPSADDRGRESIDDDDRAPEPASEYNAEPEPSDAYSEESDAPEDVDPEPASEYSAEPEPSASRTQSRG
jgi:predicted RNA-binding protein YlqC (UPF0109 family)